MSIESLEILKQEINVEQVNWQITNNAELSVILDTTITDDLRARGEMREVIRVIQDLRKEANVAFDARVDVQLPSWPKQFEEEIKKKTLVKVLVRGAQPKIV